MKWICCLLVGLCAGELSAAGPTVTTMRVPDGGLQPQVTTDGSGGAHMVFLKGDPRRCDVFYVRSTDGGATWSQPIRVNTQSGSAVAMGTIRGAQLALGKNGRVHVAWNGSREAGAGMLYARWNDAGTAFEPQRNLMHWTQHLDGGGSVAADGAGNVYVIWHAAPPDAKSEQDRRMYVASSADDGKTFAREAEMPSSVKGVCPCCSVRAFADGRGGLFVLYRAAATAMDRDMVLLATNDPSAAMKTTLIHPWQVGICPMSSASFVPTATGLLGAWETAGQVYFGLVNPLTFSVEKPLAAPGDGQRKHPVLATNGRGDVFLAWTEGTGWQRGGAVAWQVFDKNGQPITGTNGRVDGVPVWGLAAAFARADGSFVVVY
jgi:hypothetical protein